MERKQYGAIDAGGRGEREPLSATIVLVPMGPVPGDLLPWLAARLQAIVGQEVGIGEAIPLPQRAYDARRHQYRGDGVMAELQALGCPGADRVIGLVEADCYAPGLNFVFGQATLTGRDAFVALPRLRQGYYGRPHDEALFRERVLKETLHELGHTWGLRHCPDPRCVMYFSNTLADTDAKGLEFCPHCQEA
ncbi:MAG: archaemetzincin family Zn-dependent metalloprotease [Anaerolineae bacterium]|nr:archaemetzincin family Zn-dependent metalloprotease [Anaerolineae bacterium]